MVPVSHEAICRYLLEESWRNDGLIDWPVRHLMIVLSFNLLKFELEVSQIPGRLALRKMAFVLTRSSLLCDIGQFSDRVPVIPRRHRFHALF